MPKLKYIIVILMILNSSYSNGSTHSLENDDKSVSRPSSPVSSSDEEEPSSEYVVGSGGNIPSVLVHSMREEAVDIGEETEEEKSVENVISERLSESEDQDLDIANLLINEPIRTPAFITEREKKLLSFMKNFQESVLKETDISSKTSENILQKTLPILSGAAVLYLLNTRDYEFEESTLWLYNVLVGSSAVVITTLPDIIPLRCPPCFGGREKLKTIYPFIKGKLIQCHRWCFRKRDQIQTHRQRQSFWQRSFPVSSGISNTTHRFFNSLCCVNQARGCRYLTSKGVSLSMGAVIGVAPDIIYNINCFSLPRWVRKWRPKALITTKSREVYLNDIYTIASDILETLLKNERFRQSLLDPHVNFREISPEFIERRSRRGNFISLEELHNDIRQNINDLIELILPPRE